MIENELKENMKKADFTRNKLDESPIKFKIIGSDKEGSEFFFSEEMDGNNTTSSEKIDLQTSFKNIGGCSDIEEMKKEEDDCDEFSLIE